MNYANYTRKHPVLSPSLTGYRSLCDAFEERALGWVFMLAFLLGGCKPSRSVETQTAAVSVENIRLADSLHTDLSVQFDLLDYWVFDSISFDTCSRPVVKGAKHIALHNVEETKTITKTKTEQVADSTDLRTQEVIYPVRTPPKLPVWLVIIFFIFLLYWKVKSEK